MIVYALRCDSGHGFEAWFKDAASFDSLSAAGEVACPDCGSIAVAKAPMAPNIARSRGAAALPVPVETHPKPEPRPAAERKERLGALREALLALRRHVEATHDYVGDRFAEEARAMHDGAAAEREIYGEATLEEARDLLEEGIPVAPLPMVRTDS